jgi:hypothetical protein
MTNANQFYNAASISLTAGTYYISGTITIHGPSQKTSYVTTAKIYAGTTTYGSTEFAVPPTTGNFVAIASLAVSAIVTVASTTTIFFGAASTLAATAIVATPVNNGANATNTASGMVALKIS